MSEQGNLHSARLHALARRRAHELRRQAVDRLFAGIARHLRSAIAPARQAPLRRVEA